MNVIIPKESAIELVRNVSLLFNSEFVVLDHLKMFNNTIKELNKLEEYYTQQFDDLIKEPNYELFKTHCKYLTRQQNEVLIVAMKDKFKNIPYSLIEFLIEEYPLFKVELKKLQNDENIVKLNDHNDIQNIIKNIKNCYEILSETNQGQISLSALDMETLTEYSSKSVSLESALFQISDVFKDINDEESEMIKKFKIYLNCVDMNKINELSELVRQKINAQNDLMVSVGENYKKRVFK